MNRKEDLFLVFLNKELKKCEADENYENDNRENFAFSYLKIIMGYDVEQDEEASQYLLKATNVERYKYLIEVIIPKIESSDEL